MFFGLANMSGGSDVLLAKVRLRFGKEKGAVKVRVGYGLYNHMVKCIF